MLLMASSSVAAIYASVGGDGVVVLLAGGGIFRYDGTDENFHDGAAASIKPMAGGGQRNIERLALVGILLWPITRFARLCLAARRRGQAKTDMFVVISNGAGNVTGE